MGFMVGSASDGIDKEGVLLTQWMRLGVGEEILERVAWLMVLLRDPLGTCPRKSRPLVQDRTKVPVGQGKK